MKRILITILGLAAAIPAGAQQQGRQLSLDEALRLAETQSEAIRIAQAGVMRARGQQMQARSTYMPQVGFSAAYTRALQDSMVELGVSVDLCEQLLDGFNETAAHASKGVSLEHPTKTEMQDDKETL